MRLADLDVLIVDDHDAMRAMLTRALAAAGATRVRTAADGAEALSLLRAQPAALIVADQNMPGMDGLALIAAVRADAALAGARIVMLSGHADARDADAARAVGADAVLVKPASPRDVLAAVAEVLANGD